MTEQTGSIQSIKWVLFPQDKQTIETLVWWMAQESCKVKRSQLWSFGSTGNQMTALIWHSWKETNTNKTTRQWLPLARVGRAWFPKEQKGVCGGEEVLPPPGASGDETKLHMHPNAHLYQKSAFLYIKILKTKLRKKLIILAFHLKLFRNH